MPDQNIGDLKEYRILETRLYGEIMKICRRYTSELNIISMLGILEIVKQEIKDLDKTDKRFMRGEISDSPESDESEMESRDSNKFA